MAFIQQSDFRLSIGCDHAGFVLKNEIIFYLKEKRVGVKDFGTFSPERVDYPDFAVKVARSVAAGEYGAGILICGTGIGMSIVANKIRGIRAALSNLPVLAEYSRRHNDANILCLGGRILSPEQAIEIVHVWLSTDFEGGRHANRLNKIPQLTGRT